MAMHWHTYQCRDSDLRGLGNDSVPIQANEWRFSFFGCRFEFELRLSSVDYYYVQYYEFNCRDAACSYCVTLILINDSIHHHHILNLADDDDGNQVIWASFLKPDESISEGYGCTGTPMSSGVKFSNGIQVEWTVRRLNENAKYKTHFKSSEKPKNQVKRDQNSHANTETPNPICDGARDHYSVGFECTLHRGAYGHPKQREKFREFAKR